MVKKPTGRGKRREEIQLRAAAAKLSLPDSVPVKTEKSVLDQWAKDLTDSRDVGPVYRIMNFNNGQESIIREDLIQQRRLASSIEKGYKKASPFTQQVMRVNLINAYLLEGALSDKRRARVLDLLDEQLKGGKFICFITEKSGTNMRQLTADALLLMHNTGRLGKYLVDPTQRADLERLIAENDGVATREIITSALG